MKKLQKGISIVTSVATTVSLSGVAMLMPVAVMAADVVDGDLIRNPNAEGAASLDIYIVKVVGDKKFKRLVLSPHVFESYAHFDKNGNGNNWDDVMDVDQSTMDQFTTTDLVREDGNDKVYRLYAEEGSDTGNKYWLNMTAEAFTAVFDADAIYTINATDTAGYTAGADVTDPNATFPPSGSSSTGSLTVTLAADTPAAGIAVGNAARLPFTKVNLTATGGDVVVDQLIVERTGLAQDDAFSSVDVVDGASNIPLNTTSKTFNSEHKATFNDDFTVANGTTKSIFLAANMASSLASYAGETPALSLAGITVKDSASTNVSLPITGNIQTINGTITIGTATVQRGAYTNATSTSIQVGKEDYTYLSFQIQAGSAEKVQFSQVKIYQEGSASLGSDVNDLELFQDGTKIADGEVADSKYVNFSFDTIELDKGETAQFQVKADVDDGSARTIQLGVYKTTDLLVKGVTYGYNITPTYSGTGRNPTSPIFHDNQFTISNGTLQVSRSNDVGAGNVSVANDQILGSFEFECKGEEIDISALTLTVTSGGGTAQIEDALSGVELVDPNGKVVAGPTDITNNALTVAWTDTFTVPVGTSVYKVRGDLSTSGGWASDDTIYVGFTPSAMTATGVTTGNSISATPGSVVNGNTQTVKAAGLTVTRNTLPATGNVIVNQNDLVLASWNFDATDSGEDIRVTSVLVAARGQAASNTDALTLFIDNNKDGEFDSGDETLSPVNDAVSAAAATSTFAFDDPIIIDKGESIHLALKGDKDTTSSDDTENWGLTDATASVIAYGVSTGNSVAESLTADDGATLTSVVNGTLVIETTGNPAAAIVVAGSAGNVFTNVGLTAKYENLDVDELTVFVGDGSYAFTPGDGEYRDVSSVTIYDGTSAVTAGVSIPSTGKYTFNFDKGDIEVVKGATNTKVLTVKADMSTIDPDTDNAPGTNSADIKIGFGGADGVKTTGQGSNAEITTSTYEDYRSSTSSEMILRSSAPTVTLPSSSDSLGAATSLTDGSLIIYAFKVTAPSDGGDVLLYRTTFAIATSGSGMTVTNVRIDDEDGNTIKSAANPTDLTSDGSNDYYYTATFNDPVISNGDDKEAIKVAAGTSETFKVYATVSGSSANESLTTFLIGDTASTSSDVNTDNTADAFGAPNGDFASDVNNFVWSDNYKAKSVSGTGGNNATSAAQWYNGHLVSGLGNVVSTTSYIITQ